MIENNLKHEFLEAVVSGLNAEKRSLPTRFIYDDAGSRLFEKIMALPEYYLSRTEYQILKNQGNNISSVAINRPINLVELGAGNGIKTALLLEHFIQQNINIIYTPIDISQAALDSLIHHIQPVFPDLKIHPMCSDYFQAMEILKQQESRTRFVLFLGSNIGNMNMDHAHLFFNTLHSRLLPGDFVLVGFDMIKDYKMLNRAYYDSQGVTAAFNLNLLTRINKELGGHFNVDLFRFYSYYNPLISAIESFIVSLENQDISIDAASTIFHFNQWEAIHTEYSFKYSLRSIELLAEDCGFSVSRHFQDENVWFTDSLWKV